jgi:type II secretory pathway pseudopilin PulG
MVICPPSPVFQPAATSRNPRLAAFSLTDLLVLVAVLSILGAIVSLGLLKSARKARLATCLTNLGKVNRAVAGFCADNQQRLPAPVPGDNHVLWWWYKEQVKRYAGLTGESSAADTVFACPDDRGYSDPMPFHQNGRFDFGSYVFNGVTLPNMPSIAGLPLSAVQHPGRTLQVMEWTAHAPLAWHSSRTGKKNAPFYRDAQSVCGFVDGHVSLTRIYYDGYNAAYTQDPVGNYDYQYSPN